MRYKIFFSVLISGFSLFIGCKNENKNDKAPEQQEQTDRINRTSKNDSDSFSNKNGNTEGPKYVCFTRNDNKEKRIWIAFNKDNIAQKIKYEGQDQTIELRHIEEKYHEGGAHPTIVNEYDEIDQGRVTGHYKHTHSGIWDYVTYTHGKETFKYTIDHEKDPYGSKPCF